MKFGGMKKLLLCGSLALLILYVLIPLPEPLFKPDYSTVVLDTHGKILRAFLNHNEQWCFPPDPNLVIPDKLKKAVLYFEDRYFYYHPGVNPVSLVRALRQNLRSPEIVSGASTLTMQVARLIQPKPRTYLNKGLEILQAVKIEIRYSKNDILNLYLNHAPFGRNIIGYQAAALRYFQKMPAQLTWSEATILAVLPNAPGLIFPTPNNERLKQKRDRLLTLLHHKKVIDQETYRLAILEPLPEMSQPLQFNAPHLAQVLYDRYGSARPILRTTIVQEHQQIIEQMLQQHVASLQPLGIHNGAVVVAETQTGKVRAYVGSQNFFDAGSRGQVNGVLAPRSSGSLLKPFLYALCIDEGILLPQTKIRDVPTSYGAFSPANASQKYDGLVSAKDALVRSLNVPAVRLLNTYGLYSFYLFLKATGIQTLFRSPQDYGLPLILGGAEVTVWDMATLFRGLAAGGQFQPLRLLEEDDSQEQTANAYQLISQGACYLTLNMLRELKRPGAEYYWEQYQNQWPLAWKTGTSYGQRDAWAVGVSPQWAIAIWIGNFNGEGNANLSGASCAGPLLFTIFNYLPKEPSKSWFEKPEQELELVKLCLQTGQVAGPDCKQTILAEAPRQMKPLQVCSYHQGIFVTLDEQQQVCSQCWQPGEYKRISRLIYPADVVQYLRESGQMISDLPPHRFDCPTHSDNLALQILYPQENACLWIPRDYDGSLQQVTARVAHRDKNHQLYWYLDDQYCGSSQALPSKPLKLTKGWHNLEVVDQTGNRDHKRFYVDLRSD